MRSLVSIGVHLPLETNDKYAFWTVNDNFCVPDSVYHPENNPDGHEKLGKLVQMCEAL